ncbi:hypothetical protein ACIQNU_43345 [Streptomyces sp. NPDC091292]|uniref:hypothetical protein n=1 Tax=Streptomyces sp. NPDC091292 TaxID=3365991 RepID=UPI00381E03AD
MESLGVRAHVECVSGSPPCGAEPPDATKGLTPDDIEAWAEYHFRRTGHRRYERFICDTVQWDPPADVDPLTINGVTT